MLLPVHIQSDISGRFIAVLLIWTSGYSKKEPFLFARDRVAAVMTIDEFKLELGKLTINHRIIRGEISIKN